jgi:hypothetical protein
MWRACERFNIRPSDVKPDWDDNSVWAQAQMIAYSQIRCYEEDEENINMYRALGAKL